MGLQARLWVGCNRGKSPEYFQSSSPKAGYLRALVLRLSLSSSVCQMTLFLTWTHDVIRARSNSAKPRGQETSACDYNSFYFFIVYYN